MTLSHVQKVRILYKTVLKLHKGLPHELQLIGTLYVRDEFRRHKQCKTEEAEIFMKEWTDYALTLAKQLGLKGPKTGATILGKALTPSELEILRDEQICQLYELLIASKAENVEESPPK